MSQYIQGHTPHILNPAVLRFGFDAHKFADANGALADFAAFVGLPSVGLSFLRRIKAVRIDASDTTVLILLGCVEAMTRGMHPKSRELMKVIMNFVFFVAPVVTVSLQRQNYECLAGIALFVLAGLVITADRHKLILGVRCENWFHYCIGVAAYLIALGI